MKTTNRFLGLLVAAVLTSNVALAGDGIVRGAELLSKSDKALLLDRVTLAKKSSASTFDTIAQIRASMPKIEAKKQGRVASVSPMLVALGKDAVLPMLERLALGTDTHADLNESGWTAWRVGLLEAVGKLRDDRATPFLFSVLDGQESDVAVVQAAATAVARLGTQAAADKLTALSQVPGRKIIALKALGDCRRVSSARTLAKELAASTDDVTTRAIVISLGNVGSSWAWATPELVAVGEGDATRRAATVALVSAYPRLASDLRGDVEDAIRMTEMKDLAQIIDAAKAGTNADSVKALENLKQKLSAH